MQHEENGFNTNNYVEKEYYFLDLFVCVCVCKKLANLF
jgi:hypothetical protein